MLSDRPSSRIHVSSASTISSCGISGGGRWKGVSRGVTMEGSGEGKFRPQGRYCSGHFYPLHPTLCKKETVPISRENSSYVRLRPAPISRMHIGRNLGPALLNPVVFGLHRASWSPEMQEPRLPSSTSNSLALFSVFGF